MTKVLQPVRTNRMDNTEKLIEHIESSGVTGTKVLQNEAAGEQYKNDLQKLLEIVKYPYLG